MSGEHTPDSRATQGGQMPGSRPTPDSRVVVRRELPDASGKPSSGWHTDVIGHVLSCDDEAVVVRPQAVGGLPSTAEAVRIPWEQVKVLKTLSPRTVRNSEIRAVEAATAAAFPGLEHRWTSCGQWLLRAGDGVTERSNSAAPLGASAKFLPIPWDEITEFYQSHQLPVQLLIPDRIAPRLNAECTYGPEIVVMTKPLEGEHVETHPEFQFRIDEQPDEQWLSMYHFRGEPLPVHALELLRKEIKGTMGFGRLLTQDSQTVAITRGTITNEYLGYSAVEVHPDFRRRGLGTLLGQHMLQWGTEMGAHTAYLQVIATNEAGLGLYHKLGFLEHHRHRYVRMPNNPLH